ncbi:MAG: hypothetical protein AAGM21_10155 [Pseudomonadota bacterium]
MGKLRGRSTESLKAQLEEAIIFDHPDLTVDPAEKDKVVVRGTLHLMPLHPNNKGQGAVASFDVQIHFYRHYPMVEPRLYETSNRIERIQANHINPNGSCCFEVWEAWLARSKDWSASSVIDGPITDFFRWQYAREHGLNDEIGEYAHGRAGVLQALSETLGCKADGKTVERHLAILRKRWLRRRWICPCGSQERVGSCCYKRLFELKARIPPELATLMTDRLRSQ